MELPIICLPHDFHNKLSGISWGRKTNTFGWIEGSCAKHWTNIFVSTARIFRRFHMLGENIHSHHLFDFQTPFDHSADEWFSLSPVVGSFSLSLILENCGVQLVIRRNSCRSYLLCLKDFEGSWKGEETKFGAKFSWKRENTQLFY